MAVATGRIGAPELVALVDGQRIRYLVAAAQAAPALASALGARVERTLDAGELAVLVLTGRERAAARVAGTADGCQDSMDRRMRQGLFTNSLLAAVPMNPFLGATDGRVRIGLDRPGGRLSESPGLTS